VRLLYSLRLWKFARTSDSEMRLNLKDVMYYMYFDSDAYKNKIDTDVAREIWNVLSEDDEFEEISENDVGVLA